MSKKLAYLMSLVLLFGMAGGASAADIYWDGGREAWIGHQRTSVEMIYRLIRNMWIREDSVSERYWHITERGMDALEVEL